MKRFDVRTQERVAWGLLILLMLVYAVEMSHQAILRYDTFKATAFDLGNMDQVIWNTIHGRLFQFTNQAIDWYGPSTRLAIHFEPIILPLSLLYLLYADPRTLLVFQTLALASGSLPVFLLTRKYLPQWPLLATIMAGAYLMSPALLGLNIFDFHPVSLATPLLLYAILALTYRRYRWFLLACILAAACKEDVPFAIAGLGLILIWKYKLPRLGLALLIGGILWGVLAFGVIIPHFYPGVQHNNYWYRYEDLGSTPESAVINILLHPWILFTTFITLDRFYYVASLLRSTGFLALLAPEWLLPALPGLAINLLTNDPLYYSGVYHYNAAIIPFVMLAAIHGTQRLLLIWQNWRGDRFQDNPNQTRNEEDRRGMVGAGSSPNFLALAVALETVTLKPLALKPFALKTVVLAHFLQTKLTQLATPAWNTIQTRWQLFSERMQPLAKNVSTLRLQWIVCAWITLMIGTNFMIAKPQLNIFWADHEPGSREQQIQQLLAKIPPNASVSAGSNLNPHLSERQFLLVFPEISDNVHKSMLVEYIIVDLDNIYTENRSETTSTLNDLIHPTPQNPVPLYRVLAQADGVILLKRTDLP